MENGNQGWIKLHRKVINNPYYFSEKFCRSMAWIDMLLLANHAPGIFYKRGIKVCVGKGQLGYDVDSLSKRWKWSRNKVERWLRELETSNQIVRQKSNITTLITIVNYELYQGNGNAKGKPKSKPDGKADGKADGHKQEGKEGKEVIYSAFYDSEIEKNPDVLYLNFVKFLFGDNDLERPFSKLLKMNDQISYKKYLRLKESSELYGTKIFETCRNLDNYTKKNYSSLYTTLSSWLKPKN